MIFRLSFLAALLGQVVVGQAQSGQNLTNPLRSPVQASGQAPPAGSPLIMPAATSPLCPRGTGPWSEAQSKARQEFSRWLGRNLRYPGSALREGAEGQVVMQLTVNAGGMPEKITFLRMVPFGKDSTDLVTDADRRVVRDMVGEARRLLQSARFESATGRTEEEVRVRFLLKKN